MQAFCGNLCQSNVDAIVNAANGCGILGKGVAGAIAKNAGDQVTHEAKECVKENNKVFEPGEVYVTSSGKLEENGIKYVFHAVTMSYPGSLADLNSAKHCMSNIIRKAQEYQISSIAIPGLGIGIGGLDRLSVARIMVDTVKKSNVDCEFYFIDMNHDFIDKINLFIK